MKRLTNPTQHLFNAWLAWFVENDMTTIEVVCHCRLVISDGFAEHLKRDLIRLNISAEAVRNFTVTEDGVSFDCTQNNNPVSVQLPWQAIMSLGGVTANGTGYGVPFGNLEVNGPQSANLGDYDAEVSPAPKRPTLSIVK